MNRTRLNAALAALLLVGLLSAPAGSAHATERVLGMNVEGDRLSKKDKDDLLKVVQAKLGHYPALELLQPPASELMDEMIDLECIDIDLSCLAKLGKKYKADTVFYAQIDAGKGDAYVVVVKVVEAAAQKLVRDSSTDVPAAAGLGPALEAEIEAAFGKPPTPPVVAQTGTLVIRPNVPGAAVYVGTDLVGTGTVELEKPPGDYAVRVVQDGYLEQIVSVTVVAGQKTTQEIELKMAAGGIGPGPGGGKIDDDDDDGWILWTVIGAVVVGGTIAVIAATSGGGDDTVRAPVVFSIDGNNAWRDASVIGGRP
ncbi:MAG: PEGA domain-containing protein [Deltaproteobacteria bacterium]|nr:MAG: PEGA domain-containing protein [Deltaproteobacteria bacterium]